jgi:hypothetical protein
VWLVNVDLGITSSCWVVNADTLDDDGRGLCIELVLPMPSLDALKSRSRTPSPEPSAAGVSPDVAELYAEVGDGMKGYGGVSWGCSTPPLLHRRSDTP